jgi:hypothetical protein
MRPEHAVSACLACLAMLGAPPTLRAEETPAATAARASLPLEEVLRLVRENERAREPRPAPAPLAAAVSRLVLSGRLLEDAVDLSAHIELAVLAEDTWVRVPLLKLAPEVHLSSLPVVEGGELLADGGTLSFLTRTPGRHSFELGLLVQARPEGAARLAELGVAGAALTRLDLQWDEGLFRLLGDGDRRGAEGASLFPLGERFRVRWAPRAPRAPAQAEEAPAERPPVESVITAAHASSVTTLEGRRITRVQYALRFEGRQPLSFRLPAGTTVEKVYLNGASAPFRLEGEELMLEVAPPRVGDQSGRLELVLVDQPGAFHLSGRLSLSLPAASWQLDELQVSLHLPPVFDYAWAGGSLALDDSGAAGEEVEWAHRLPTPGKQLRFRQSLVGSAPDVSVRYTVALEGQYYRGGPASAGLPPAAGAARAPHPEAAVQVAPADQAGLSAGRWGAGD